MPSGWTLAAALILNGALTALLAAVVPNKLRALGMIRHNFAGQPVVTACGVILVAGALPTLMLLLIHSHAADSAARAIAALLLGFGALGFADDRWGTPAAKGLRGHLRKFVRERTLTSGLVKAAGGVMAALFVAATSPWCSGLLLIVCAAIIALSANAVNLLDLRPGRASAMALALLVGCMAVLWHRGLGRELASVAAVAVPAMVLYVPDARAKLMLGDTGSNALGACVGAAILLAFPGAAARSIALIALIGLHVVAERWSLSSIIEANPVLRTMDRWTGVR